MRKLWSCSNSAWRPILKMHCIAIVWHGSSSPDQKRCRNAEKALPLAQRAIALAANHSSYLNTLGVVYYRLGKFDQAVETLKSGSKLTSNRYIDTLNNLFLAMSYHRLGQADEARECFRQAPRWTAADKLPPHLAQESEAIRAEAAALLGVK